MRILGSRLLTTLVIANVVLGVMAVGADWLARETYWPFEPVVFHMRECQK